MCVPRATTGRLKYMFGGYKLISSYQVLARKWRPSVFSDVKGQEHIIKTLKNSIINNRVAHAYLFSGSRGVGKTSVARLLAKALCCQNPKDAEPCNVCRSCVEISKGASMDVQEIDGASNNGVDSIRDIRDNIMYPPSSEKYRIYIIDEVHMLSNGAFNALLKTLEEPPAHGVFIFATTEPNKIPPTIVSRCQSFDFKKLSVEAIAATIKEITEKEQITTTPEALYAIAREARGSLRDSLSMLDQIISFAGRSFTKEDVKSVLGFVDRAIVFEMVKGIVTNQPKTVIELSKKLFNDGYDVKKVADNFVNVFKELVFIKNGLENLLADTLPDYELAELKAIASQTSPSDVEQWFFMANSSAEESARSAYAWTIFEVSLLSMCNKPNNSSVAELLNKLNSMDKGLLTTVATQSLLQQQQTPEKKTFQQLKAQTKEPEWNEILKAVYTKDKELGEVLHKFRYAGLEDGKNFVVDCSDYPDLMAGIAQRVVSVIQEILYELYGGIYKIDIRNSVVMQRVETKLKKKQSLLDKEVVKDTVEIMGAKVKGVKIY